MDGIEKIIQRLEDDAAAEIDAIISEGRAQAASVTAAYKEKADAEYAAIVEKGRSDAEERMKRLRSMADLEARKLLLAEKQSGINAAFDLAREKISQLDREQRVQLYAKLAAGSAVTGNEELIFSASERQELGAETVAAANRLRPGAAFTLSSATTATDGGLILCSDKMDVNCTFDAIFRMLRESMAGEIGALLYD